MFAFAGPAYLVSVGYMDPGNWATDLEGGARFGYQLLWVLISAAVVIPMVALVFAQLDAVLALSLGVAAGAALIAILIATSPVVEITDDELRVGRAHIPVALLGDAVALVGDDAREARGPGLSAASWHRLRGGIDGVVRVPVLDERDPADAWVFSTRTPDRVVVSLARAQRA